jgi:hypothetical protein
MDDLDKALGEISSIREQVARSTQFHGYGPATLAATGAIAVLAAGLQAHWVSDPANHIFAYLGIWVPAAMVSGRDCFSDGDENAPDPFGNGG